MEHATDLPILAFGDRNGEPALLTTALNQIWLQVHQRRARLAEATTQLNASSQPRNRGFIHSMAEAAICLEEFPAGCRISDMTDKAAVSCEDQQTRSLSI